MRLQQVLRLVGSGKGRLIGIALLGLVISAFLGASTTDKRQSLKREFESLLNEAPQMAWKDAVVSIYAGSRALRCDWRLFPDRSKAVFTAKEESGRRTTLHFYDFVAKKSYNVKLLADDKAESLTLWYFRISPDSKSIWLLIVPAREGEQKGHMLTWIGHWFRYDVEKQALVPEGNEYKQLLDFARGVGQEPPRAWPGPVWSFPDGKLHMAEPMARKAGVNRFWRNLENLPRHSEISFAGTRFEMITGAYKKGHVFVKGKYITSVSMASRWVPQDCWFIQGDKGVVVYKFYGYGKRGCWKSSLDNRTSLNVWDIPGTGVVVFSRDKDKEYIDLIPSELPKK